MMSTALPRAPAKPHLSFWQVLNMNVGFFGIQFSFGLQQSNMSPIYKYLGADEASLPLLWLAGPVTGLLVQPVIGAMSDRTTSRWGRRTPYFLIGALLCSLGLLVMPFSPTLWFAASLLWILDAANNVTMEPYRAYVSDRLDKSQHSIGFLTQSAFTGLAQTLAYLSPSILVFLGMNKDAVNDNHIPHITVAAFLVGALLSFTTVYWSVRTVPELPMDDAEIDYMAASLKSILDPDLVFMAEVGGQPVGVSITLPDYNQVLKSINGRLLPFGWLKVLLGRSKIDTARVFAMGIVPEYRKRGIDVTLGRQRRSDSGVLGRFDGLRLTSRLGSRFEVAALAGLPVQSLRDTAPNTDKVFAGGSVTVSLFSTKRAANTPVMADPETWAMACSAVIGPRVSRSPVAAWSAAAERSLRLWAMIAGRGSRDEKMQRVKMCLSLRISVSN